MATSLVVVALPIALVGLVLEWGGRQAMITEKQNKLFTLTRILDAELGPGFDALLADLPSGYSDRQAAIRHLNAKLAGLTDRIAAADSGIGVGFYSRRLDAILTYGPSSRYAGTVGMSIHADHPGRKVMEQAQQRVEFGKLVRGSIMNAMLPVVRNGQAIGYIWANEFTGAIQTQQRAIDRAVVLASLAGIAAAFIIIHLLSRRLTEEVGIIVDGLEAMKLDLHRPIPRLRDELGDVVVAINAMAKALLDARSLTENILTSVADGILAVDVQGRITALNPAAEKLYGASAAEMLGHFYQERFAAGTMIHSPLLDTLETGRTHFGSTFEFPSQGQWLRINATSSILRDADGTQIGAVVVLKDVSERDRLMVQVMRADRLAALGELTAGIAHEIRNPLTSIRGFMQYLEECESLEEWRRYGPLIIRQVDSMNHIIGELLAFGRPRPPRIGKVQVQEIVSEMAFLARGKSDAQVDLDLEPLPPIDADGEALKQALLNLIINAIQAIPEGGRVHVTARREGPSQVAIRVIDNGAGIDPANLDKVFDPFFSTKPNGTGLGLAMVHRIVDAHHGVIAIDSRPGQGTTVTVTLPINHREPEASA